MKLEGRFRYQKAIILTPERVRELETICLKYCKSVSYEATTVAGTEITFTSVEELLSYDNFQNRRVKALTVTGWDGYDRVIICIFEAGGLEIISGYNETCVCRYTVPTVEVESSLKVAILDFLKKSTARYWLMGKIRLFGILLISSVIAGIYVWIAGIGNHESHISIPAFIFCFLIGYGIIGLITLIDRQVLKRLFPAIAFVWGEESSNYKRYEQIRHNLFWAVLIAAAVGIAAAFIKDLLPLV